MRIEQITQLAGHDAYALAAAGWLELVNSKLAERGGFMPSWDNKAIVAYDDNGDLVGVIAYEIQPGTNTIFVTLSHVSRHYRGLGYFGAMWADLKLIAAKEGVRYIQGGTHIDNKAALAVFEKLGRKPVYIFHQFPIEKAVKE